jgi:hypothetical protein
MQTKEFMFSGVRMNGFLMLFLVLLLLVGIVLLYVTEEVWGIVTASALFVGWIILLVVLCADESAQPVLNTGTLYQ